MRAQESEGERYLQDSRGAPYAVDKSYHDELDRTGDPQGNVSTTVDMDYCDPSFANSFFAPSNKYDSSKRWASCVHTHAQTLART